MCLTALLGQGRINQVTLWDACTQELRTNIQALLIDKTCLLLACRSKLTLSMNN